MLVWKGSLVLSKQNNPYSTSEGTSVGILLAAKFVCFNYVIKKMVKHRGLLYRTAVGAELKPNSIYHPAHIHSYSDW